MGLGASSTKNLGERPFDHPQTLASPAQIGNMFPFPQRLTSRNSGFILVGVCLNSGKHTTFAYRRRKLMLRHAVRHLRILAVTNNPFGTFRVGTF